MLNTIHNAIGAKRTNPLYVALAGMVLVLTSLLTLAIGTPYALTFAMASLGIVLGAVMIVANPKSTWGTQQ